MNENVFAIEYMYLTRDILSIGKPAGKPGTFSHKNAALDSTKERVTWNVNGTPFCFNNLEKETTAKLSSTFEHLRSRAY